MVVVMKSGASKEQVEHVTRLVREMGLQDHIIVGSERTVVAVIGNDRFKDRTVLETVEGVEKVVPILAPYKMASREVKKERTQVPLGEAGGRGGGKESRGHCRAVQRGESKAIAGDSQGRAGSRRRRIARRGVQAENQSVFVPGPGGRGFEITGRSARADGPGRGHGSDGCRAGRSGREVRRRAAGRRGTCRISICSMRWDRRKSQCY